jgi:hypothetical protein
MLLALDSIEPGASRAILSIDVDPILPLAGAAMELDAGVFPDSAEEGPGEILEVVVPLGGWDLLAGRSAHGSLRGELDMEKSL